MYVLACEQCIPLNNETNWFNKIVSNVAILFRVCFCYGNSNAQRFCINKIQRRQASVRCNRCLVVDRIRATDFLHFLSANALMHNFVWSSPSSAPFPKSFDLLYISIWIINSPKFPLHITNPLWLLNSFIPNIFTFSGVRSNSFYRYLFMLVR